MCTFHIEKLLHCLGNYDKRYHVEPSNHVLSNTYSIWKIQKSQCMWKVHIISTFFSESVAKGRFEQIGHSFIGPGHCRSIHTPDLYTDKAQSPVISCYSFCILPNSSCILWLHDKCCYCVYLSACLSIRLSVLLRMVSTHRFFYMPSNLWYISLLNCSLQVQLTIIFFLLNLQYSQLTSGQLK